MTVRELIVALSGAAGDDVVTCSPGGGVLDTVTLTVNGCVILDAHPDAAVAAELARRASALNHPR